MKFNIEMIFDLGRLTKELALGLRNLDFSNNFNSMEATVVIPATSEIEIPNTLKFIPKKYIITSQVGNGLITKSSTEWTANNLYLYNNGSVEVTAEIIFLK